MPRRNNLTRLRVTLKLPILEPAAPPDPDKRDQAPAHYGTEGCRWCGGKIIRPRRTFCGESCVNQFKLRSSGTYRRQVVFVQQGPMCQACGIDTREIGVSLRTDPERARLEYGLGLSRTSRPHRLQGAVFDVEHRLPVAHGGGGCGLDNLMLICPACHAAITWATRPRRGGVQSTTKNANLNKSI
jgi:hypothetical protein